MCTSKKTNTIQVLIFDSIRAKGLKIAKRIEGKGRRENCDLSLQESSSGFQIGLHRLMVEAGDTRLLG